MIINHKIPHFDQKLILSFKFIKLVSTIYNNDIIILYFYDRKNVIWYLLNFFFINLMISIIL